MTGFGETVTCRRHGPMRFQAHLYRWTCAGFDGEGCENYLNAEEVALAGEEDDS